MGVNWIKLSTGEILVDLREDTVAPGKMLDGTTAHDASGAPIEGNIPSVNGGTFQPTTAEQTIVEGGSYVKNDVKIAAATAGEDLSAEITEYGSLNDELEEVINSLPSAGGGGSGVDTCTLKIGTSSSLISRNTWSVLVYENGAFSVYHPSLNMLASLDQLVIENVVCGSFCLIDDAPKGNVDSANTQNITIIDTRINTCTAAVINASAGSVARINYS